MRLCCRLWAASVGSVLSLELCPLRLPPARLPPRPVASRPVASALTDGCDGRRTASRTAVPIFDIHLNPELPDHLAYQVDPRSPPPRAHLSILLAWLHGPWSCVVCALQVSLSANPVLGLPA